ncbi:MAG: hypothetical protein J7621_20700 [Niastella sp.]|nr:hypothetical protein [Niastella sp.]
MSLANYTFLPWLRTGAGRAIQTTDTLTSGGEAGSRATLQVDVLVNNTVAGTKEFLLAGPSEVVGFSKDMVIRTAPENWSTTWAPNYVAHVEFYEEDLPWRYTPAKDNDDKLRPWITLIVLKEGEFTRKETVVPLPQIELTNAAVLPPFDETWLWAHVQQISSSEIAEDIAAADHIISRLVCPRKLEANSRYYAFVIPTFESGRLAGLGRSEDDIKLVHTQDPAWGLSPQQEAVFPVYYEWFFRTAENMDFEYLASLLEARPTDPIVGRKPLDCRTPGFGLPDYPNAFTLYFEGALRAPQPAGAVTIDQGSAANLTDFSSRIKGLLEHSVSANGDPVVVPPFYGQQHIFQQSLSLTENTWIHQLNRNPAWRAASGLGATIFRKYQDVYLQKAWEQLESIVEANKIIDAANASLAICSLLYEQNIARLSSEALTAITGPVHVKIRAKKSDGSMVSLSELFRLSCFNGSIYSLGFRKLIRGKGPFRRKLERGGGNLNPEVLKKLMVLKGRTPFTLKEAKEYKDVVVIDRPKFGKPSGSFGDRQLDISSAQLEQAFTAFATMIVNEPAIAGCEERGSYDLQQAINPVVTITRLLGQVLNMPGGNWFGDPLKIKAALAYPDFEDPMVEKLQEHSPEWIAPNLDLIPNNTVTLLESNRKFIEAFMVGVNVAMNKEIRWREYPTDERGSCFRQFWNVKGIKNFNNAGNAATIAEQFKDISPIDTWKNWTMNPANAKLDLFGEHNVRAQLPEADQLVLTIKGDLLKCFPNITIYAAEALEESYTDNGATQKRMVIKPNGLIKFPVFKASSGADLQFIGFDLTVAAAKGDVTHAGWFFILQETPGEARFGLDIQAPPAGATAYSWNDASWQLVQGNYISKNDNVSSITGSMPVAERGRWGRNAADMAFILYQKPVMIAIHANEMLPSL